MTPRSRGELVQQRREQAAQLVRAKQEWLDREDSERQRCIFSAAASAAVFKFTAAGQPKREVMDRAFSGPLKIQRLFKASDPSAADSADAASTEAKRPVLPDQARKSRPLSASITGTSRGYANPALPKEKALNISSISAELLNAANSHALYSSFSPSGLFGVPGKVRPSTAPRRPTEERAHLRKEDNAAREKERTSALVLLSTLEELRRETNPFTTVLQLTPRKDAAFAVPVSLSCGVRCDGCTADSHVVPKSSMTVALEMMRARPPPPPPRSLTTMRSSRRTTEAISPQESSKSTPASASVTSPLIPVPPALTIAGATQRVPVRPPVVTSLPMAALVYDDCHSVFD